MTKSTEEMVGALKQHVATLRSELVAERRSAGRSLTKRSFQGAEHNRLTEGWRLTGGGPEGDLRRALPLLRRRHQDLVDNNEWASRAIGVIASNWVGSGIIGQPPGDRNGNKAGLWDEWSNTPACDWQGRLTLGGLQELWAKTIATRGSVLIRWRSAPELIADGLPPFQLETLEPDWLDTETTWVKDGALGGVQYDESGRVSGYWLRDHHGMDSIGVRSGRRGFYQRDQVIHAFEQRRPGQYDGIPWGTSAMLRIRDMGEYESSELLRQKISACFAGFLEDVDSEPDDDLTLDLDVIEPGALERLPPGTRLNFATPPVTAEQVPWLRQQLYAVAAGYGISFEALTGIYSEVNYSSGRMGWLEFHRNVARWRHGIMIPQILDRVAKWFDRSCREDLRMRAPRGRWTWTPPRRELLDPSRDIPALVESVQAGFTTLSEVQRSLGWIPAELMEELKIDLEKAREAGLVLTVDKSRDPNLLFAMEETNDTEGAEPPGTDQE